MTSSFLNQKTFLNPGVWFGLVTGNGSFPGFCSTSNLTTYLAINDLPVNVTVLPGYKIILYTNPSYTCSSSVPYIIDNTYGKEIKFCLLPNDAFVNGAEYQDVSLRSTISSFRLFFEGKEIPEQIRYVPDI
jgi:hypothetical protein